MGPFDGGMNQLCNIRTLPDAGFKYVVKSNLDTLYTSAWLDLSVEPVVLSVPHIPEERFYMFQMMDLWSNTFGSPGTRTTGTEAALFAICGPNFTGTLPASIKGRYNSDTSHVWLLGRTQILEGEALARVHMIQNEFKLYSLSDLEHARPVVPDAEYEDQPQPPKMAEEMSAEAFFTAAAAAMARGNLPSPPDAAAVAELKSLGIAPGEELDWSSLRLLQKGRLALAKQFGLTAVMIAAFTNTSEVDGWRGLPNAGQTVGNYGTNYGTRAAVAYLGLGANIPQDAVYRSATKFQLTGARDWTLTFTKEHGTPPVDAFWSMTVYNSESYLVPNAQNRYALGSQSGLHVADDGSTTIYFSVQEPSNATQRQNWLPIPAGQFSITARMYWPTEAILNDSWVLPEVVDTSGSIIRLMIA